MAEVVLGIGTSHSPLLSLDPDMWHRYAEADRNNPELVFPPDGLVRSYEDAVAHHVPASVKCKPRTLQVFERQYQACQSALDALAVSLTSVDPDVVVIVSDDQDEWFFDAIMPSIAVYWGRTVPLIPRPDVPGRDPEISRAVTAGYGDRRLTVPVAADQGRALIEYLIEHDFDVAHMTYVESEYGGRVSRRYPTPGSELTSERTTVPKPQGLPHGFAFVIKRLLANQPRRILPILQNTCYPPNTVTPRRAVALGNAIAEAIRSWPNQMRVAIIASGGLSHFVVDEDLDRALLDSMAKGDLDALTKLPRHRLLSGTSESLNWVTAASALGCSGLKMQLLDYVPVYRTEAGTGGGWAFAQWT